MKKKLPIIMIVLALITGVVAIVLSKVNNKEENLINSTETIRDTYGNLSTNVTSNIEIRKDIINKLNTFEEEDYKNFHTQYQELLQKYTENVKQIDKNIEIMDSNCKTEFEDNTLNILCRSYADLYEEVINIYITTLNNYNSKIEKYNTENQSSYESYTTIHQNYIDVNQDGIYQGQ